MLIDKLKKYAASNTYPMHMPGHKRTCNKLQEGLPHEIDLTEIHGFDDLRNPAGILLETAKLASQIYKSNKAFPLVNGSTVGVLSAIGAHTKRGDKILIAQKCHWSVDNAVQLFGLTAVYISPDNDENSSVPLSIEPKQVENALNKNPDIRLVVITSPSYEGVISDLETIAKIVHSKNIALFVDSAHGAHLGFSDRFPKNAVQSGADIVVMSLHKTLPAMTQCALLHLCTDRGNYEKTKEMLSILQTSSPSYVLMASIDSCLHILRADSAILFSQYEQNLESFRIRVKQLTKLFILCQGECSKTVFYDYDPGKIVVVTKNTKISGFELASILRVEYKIEIERACQDYLTAMTSICDIPAGFDRLANALLTIDGIV